MADESHYGMLEGLLSALCASAQKGQQNAQQTLYALESASDAKLAYDVLASCGLECKLIADDSASKLYVQNASLAACAPRISQMLGNATMLAEIKRSLDAHRPDSYALSYVNTPTGRQLTVVFAEQKAPSSSPIAASGAQATSPASVSAKPVAAKKPRKTDEDQLSEGPAVARKAIPKSLKASADEEDGPIKRLFLYASGRAFTSFAWVIFIAFLLAIVFTILVTIKGFLCPDVATNQATIPSYCPQKNVKRIEQ